MLRDLDEIPDRDLNEQFLIVELDGTSVLLTTRISLFNTCKDCYFYDEKTRTSHCEDKDYNLGYCSEHNRKDGNNVKFINVADLEKLTKKAQDYGKSKYSFKDKYLEESYYDENDINESLNLKALFTAALLASSPLIKAEAKETITTNVLNAIAQVESGKKNGIKIKDVNGRFSYGMFQIQQPYLDDANKELNTKYSVDDVRYKPEVAKKIVTAYLTKYIKKYKKDNKKDPSLKHIIAMHNGGPNGYKNDNALKYADEVLEEIKNIKKSKTSETNITKKEEKPVVKKEEKKKSVKK